VASAGERRVAVERYLTEKLVPSDAALEATLASGLPPHEVSPLEGKLLYVLARAVGARTVLELGTLAGYSTIWLGRAVPADGRVLTIEADPGHAAVARANLERAELGDVVELRVARALEALRQLIAEGGGPFDLIFLDADKASNDAYLELALELSRAGTLIVADNVVRSGAVADGGSEDASVQGVRRFFDLLAAEPRVTATALQTVGGKGHDGLALALVVSQD
jgi:predicted O-methyltransferase YrrM